MQQPNQNNNTMNLYLTDREKQTVTAALESLRSRKQAVIQTSAAFSKQDQKELRQPENEYDILSAEHTLMHAITLLSKLTSRPIAFFANPNPSQLPEPKVHPIPTPTRTANQRVAKTFDEAEAFFLENSQGSVLCVLPTGTSLECFTFPEAVAFFGKQ